MKPLRVDLLTSISGVTFRDAWRGRVAATVDGHEVAFLGQVELIHNKRAAGRAQIFSTSPSSTRSRRGPAAGAVGNGRAAAVVPRVEAGGDGAAWRDRL